VLSAFHRATHCMQAQYMLRQFCPFAFRIFFFDSYQLFTIVNDAKRSLKRNESTTKNAKFNYDFQLS